MRDSAGDCLSRVTAGILQLRSGLSDLSNYAAHVLAWHASDTVLLVRTPRRR